MNSGSLREVLVEAFGLSSYEASTYISLVQNGKQTMSELASSSDVPRQRIYDITESLRDEGFIEIIDESPKSAYAIPPADALGSIQDRIDSTIRELDQMHQTNPEMETGVAMFKNRATIEKYIRQVVRSADVTVTYVLPYVLVKKYGSLLRNVGDDINSKLIISNVPDELLEMNTVETPIDGLAREIKSVKTQEPVAICADRSIGFFWVQYGETRAREESRGFYITGSQLVLLLDRFVTELLWSEARTIIERQGPDTLPQRFLRIQDCIQSLEDVTTKPSQESIAVSFKGYETATQTEVSLTGDLIDYHITSDELRKYLVLDLGKDTTSETSGITTVGGWNAISEDFEATEITLHKPDTDNVT